MKSSTLLVSLSLLMVAVSPIVLLFAVEAEVPGPPLSVTATASGTDIILEWSPPGDGTTFVDGYRIYRGETTGNINVDLGPTTDNTFTDVNLDKGEDYFYQVAAFDDVDGESVRSEVASATIATTVPGAVNDLTASGSIGRVTLSWTSPDDDGGLAITSYTILRSESQFDEAITLATQPVTGYIDTSIVNGRTYNYWVTASNTNGMGEPSNRAMASPLTATAPGAPTNLAAVGGDGSIQVSWGAPSDNGGSDITEYRIYRAQTNVKPDAPIHTNDVAVMTYTDSVDLTMGATYYYWVSAVNGEGEGTPAGPVTAVPATVPGIPTGLTATAGDTNVSLSWTAPMDNGGASIDYYIVYRNGVDVDHPAITSTIISGLTNGVSYSFTVAAHNSKGTGDASSAASATPVSTRPSQPQSFVATPGSDKITLAWTAPASEGASAITGYNIYRSETTTKPISTLISGTSSPYEDSSISPGIRYYYWVAAVNSFGEGTISERVTAALAVVPSQPTNLVATGGNGFISLTWDAPGDDGGADITSYNIYRGTSVDSLTLFGTANDNSYTDNDVTTGVTYIYAVSAVNSAGEGAQSGTATTSPINVKSTPSVPQNLNAELQNGTVSLTWAAPSSDGGATITQYRVYRGLTDVNLAEIGTSTELSYNDTNTVKSVTYYYAVSAVNEVGEGAKSAVLNVTVPLSSVPSIPLNLNGEIVNGNVLLSWSTPTSDGGGSITGYKIYRGTSQATLSYITSVTGTSFEDTGRRDGVTYVYTVAAVNEAGDGPSATPISITVPKESVVDSPVGLVAIAGLAVVGVGSVLFLLRRNRLNP